MKEKTPKPSKAEIEEMVESCYQSLVTGKRLPKEKEAKYIGLAHELRIPLNGLGNRIFVAQELLFGLYRRRYVKKSEHKAAVHRAREVMLVENAISSIRHTHKNELEFFERLPHKTLAQRQQRAAPFKSISFSKLSNLTKQLRRLQVQTQKRLMLCLKKLR
ncbi:MAG: hypothetical protein HON47_05175 [Candidatus Diapherotrites archaeon]|uniref:Uncharacterized protein n=1 Tax=Candidatus Iainarchaeum sp. TaxID=3101447 RepID=A0A8T5GG32_9ARCH|nr:hypothetical protein [Candidatus Diapherotrites archaeon]